MPVYEKRLNRKNKKLKHVVWQVKKNVKVKGISYRGEGRDAVGNSKHYRNVGFIL